jgi:CheY-like chemotaxis protein
LRCMISIPHQLRLEFPDPSQAPAQVSAGGDLRPSNGIRRKRILVVEDESLIAMMIAQMLGELALEVVGPCGKVADAIAAIEREQIDGGILDINLGGEMAYPIARMLQSRKVPFVFMTGYGSDTVASPFPDVRVFKKPIAREVLEELFAATPVELNSATRPAAQRSGVRAR